MKEECNYEKVGEPIYKSSYDVRQEYKTDCGIRHVNLLERVFDGVKPIRVKPNGKCIYCSNLIKST